MQWSADRNAGFSRANPQRLFLPDIIDPSTLRVANVESQMQNPSSLLWWMRRLIAHAEGPPRPSAAGHQVPHPRANARCSCSSVRDEEQQVLRWCEHCPVSPSGRAGPLRTTWGDAGRAVRRVRFPTVGEDGRYVLSVGPHGFYWFQVEPAAAASAAAPQAPEVRVRLSGDTLLDDPDFGRVLEARLPRLLPSRRWFVSKARQVRGVSIVERLPLGGDAQTERALFLVDVEFTEGEAEQYALPLSATPVEGGTNAPAAEVGVLLNATASVGDKRWAVQDGMTDPAFARLMLDTALHGGEVEGATSGSSAAGSATSRPRSQTSTPLAPKIPDREQSNSNVLFGDQLILKLYRRLAEGTNPELEIGEHLTAKGGFANTAPLAGAIELLGRGGPRTLAVALTYVPNEGDAWGAFLDYGPAVLRGARRGPAEQAAALCLPGDPGCTGGEEGPAAGRGHADRRAAGAGPAARPADGRDARRPRRRPRRRRVRPRAVRHDVPAVAPAIDAEHDPRDHADAGAAGRQLDRRGPAGWPRR
jgi:maltose alpha-D-glucosyltransferase/alpha-amylase